MKSTESDSLPAEIIEHLERYSRSVLLTLRADGSPTAHPMTALVDEDALVFNTYRKSVKTRNVERDPRLAVVLLDGYEVRESETLRGFALEGDGEIRRPEGNVERRGEGPEIAEGQRERVSARLREGKRIFIRTRLTRTRAIEAD